MYHNQIVAAYGIYDLNGLGEYVQRIGEQVAQHAETDEYQWRFTVLDNESINAFALPGGYIYITRALIAHLNSEAQLAAVLGHEIGHVDGGHHRRKQTAARVVGKVSESIGAAKSSGDFSGFNLGALFGAGLVQGYGRDMELEADERGAQMIRELGYDPEAMLQVIEVLKSRDAYDKLLRTEEADGSRYHAMLASHPDKDKRLGELAAAAREAGDITRADGRDEWLQRIDGMAWAGSKAQGVIRGSHFLHEDFDFAVTFPEDWDIVNLPDRIIGYAPEQAAMMQISTTDRSKRKLRKIPVEKFLQKVIGMSKWQSARTLEIGGMEAFIATAKDMRSPFGMRTGRIATVFHGDSAFIFFGVTQDVNRQRHYDRTFDKIIRTMRRLNDEDRALAQPLAVRIVPLEEGTSLADYADIDDEENPVALLRLLNGVYPDGEPEPGSLIKTIR